MVVCEGGKRRDGLLVYKQGYNWGNSIEGTYNSTYNLLTKSPAPPTRVQGLGLGGVEFTGFRVQGLGAFIWDGTW